VETAFSFVFPVSFLIAWNSCGARENSLGLHLTYLLFRAYSDPYSLFGKVTDTRQNKMQLCVLKFDLPDVEHLKKNQA
jgi:hypothetical protein